MAHSTGNRWIEHARVKQAAKSLLAEVAEACYKPVATEKAPKYSDRQLANLNTRTIVFLVGAFGVVAAIIVVPSLLPGELLAKNGNLSTVVQWITILVPLGFGVAAKNRLRRAMQRTYVHESCVKKLASDLPGLREAGLYPVTGPHISVLPGLQTDCKPNLRCGLFGRYRGNELAMFETEYLAPVSFGARNMFEVAQAGMVSDPDKEQFSRMRTGEVIVFFRPQLELPDLFIAGKKEPLCAYLPRWVKKAGGRPREARVSAPIADFEAFSSCPDGAARAFSPRLVELLKLRPKSLVQVIGGFVVVVARSWGSATPMETAVATLEVQFDLDFACAIYEALANPAPTDECELNALEWKAAEQEPAAAIS